MAKRKRFKKGSAAARAFMAKIRNMRKGSRKVSRKQKTKKRSFRRERVNPIIIHEESTIMAKKRRKSSGKHTRKARKARRTVRTYGRRIARKRRSSRRYSGFKMPSIEKMKPMAIITEVAGIGTGAIAGSFIAKLTQRVPFLANPKITPFIPIILGIILPRTKFGKSALAKDIASGSLAVGIIAAIRQFAPQLPLLSGNEAVELLGAVEDMSPAERELLGQGSDGFGYEVLEGDDSMPAEALVGGL
jgi:hypothetical protein